MRRLGSGLQNQCISCCDTGRTGIRARRAGQSTSATHPSCGRRRGCRSPALPRGRAPTCCPRGGYPRDPVADRVANAARSCSKALGPGRVVGNDPDRLVASGACALGRAGLINLVLRHAQKLGDSGGPCIRRASSLPGRSLILGLDHPSSVTGDTYLRFGRLVVLSPIKISFDPHLCMFLSSHPNSRGSHLRWSST